MFIHVYSYLPYVLCLKYLVFQLDQGARWVFEIIFFLFFSRLPLQMLTQCPSNCSSILDRIFRKKNVTAMSMLRVVLKHYSEHEKITPSPVIIVRNLETPLQSSSRYSSTKTYNFLMTTVMGFFHKLLFFKLHGCFHQMKIHFWTNIVIRHRPRMPATSMIELFVTLV